MIPPDEAPRTVVSGSPSDAATPRPPIPLRFGLALLALLAGFGRPLFDLAVFSCRSDLYSHIVLIPCISVYLGWTNRQQRPAPTDPDRRITGCSLAAGLLVLGGYWAARLAGMPLAVEDSLALLTLSFLFLFVSVCGWFLGRATLRALAFPLGFLVFMVPFPVFLANGIETFLQHTSAAAAQMLFSLAGTTLFHHDLVFQLPGITLQVAPECSGIHSSLALFITSVVAGRFFLRTPWKMALLSLAVVPLAILRNGFRIFTLGELCVHISPDMINHWIHHRGGPVFFMLSLVPFFALLWFLHQSDQPK